MYWYGVDKEGRPILWERFSLFDWKKFNGKRKVLYYTTLFEGMWSQMPEGTNEINVVAMTEGIPYLRAMAYPSFLLSVAKLFIAAFPDRLGAFSAQTTPVVTAVMKILSPILPASIAGKMQFFTRKAHVEHLVNEVLANGRADLPDFLGGPAIHDPAVICSYAAMMKAANKAMVRAAQSQPRSE